MISQDDMTDSERRGILLRHYYGVRRKRHGRDPSPDQLEGEWDEDEVRRLTTLLYQAGLLEGYPTSDADGMVVLDPSITNAGIDVIEGNRESPVSVNNFYISNSTGFQAGQNNTQNSGD